MRIAEQTVTVRAGEPFTARLRNRNGLPRERVTIYAYHPAAAEPIGIWPLAVDR